MNDAAQKEPAAPLLAPEERRRVLSTFRLQVILTSFVVVLLAGLSVLMFSLVTRIFDTLTPSIERDLAWKSQRGVAELAQSRGADPAPGESGLSRPSC